MSKVLAGCAGFIVIIFCCFIVSVSSLFVIYSPKAIFYTVVSIFEEDQLCDKSYSNGALLNVEIKNIDKYKGFKTVEDAINQYPWHSQYIFGGPGQPSCQVLFFYRPTLSKLENININGYMGFNINNSLERMDQSERNNSYVYYNEDGYIIIYKKANLFYVYGYFGYYSV